jgi:glycosyltransferase involved in cell wall biosynthesis
MNFLFVDYQFPMFDRSSADVRMFSVIRMLSQQGHECVYYASNIQLQENKLGKEEVSRYRTALHDIGATTVERKGFEETLSGARFDVVFFKFFFPAETRIEYVRIWQPHARVVIDSVDLVYDRLLAKARLSEEPRDYAEAAAMKNRELRTYALADLVLTITEDEAAVLSRELPHTPVSVIPNIHEIPTAERTETSYPSLLFIGVFTHEPNVDGVLYFAREVWPKVLLDIPDVRWTIVGGSPPPEILALSSRNVEVTGYVPNTLPYLLSSWVSVAPLRFGAGMKGKVGESMAAGTPVVTTSFGAQGFGLSPGTHLLLADDAASFAAETVRLLRNPALRRQIGEAGMRFIEQRYSPRAVSASLRLLLDRLAVLRVRNSVRFSRLRRAARVVRLSLARHLLWRLSFRH